MEAAREIEVGLLTGGMDRPYAFGLSLALAAAGVGLDVVGSDDLDCPEMRTTPGVRFLNLRGSQASACLRDKVVRVLRYYARLIRYGARSKADIFHILWHNKIEWFDRTALLLFYRICGKSLVLTVHNVNAGKRDGNDSALNRATLKIQYRLADRIFVHTEKMKCELASDFGVEERRITVIPFGINNAVPHTSLSRAEARRRLGLGDREKVILFFGLIRPYKGLEYLAAAFSRVAAGDPSYRLVIAGHAAECEAYLKNVWRALSAAEASGQVIKRLEFIPDEETEVYFKAADVLALPYTLVFQSGVLFLAFSFGLPVVAADVGSFEDDVVEGENGFLCAPRDSAGLAKAIERYFSSQLYRELDGRRAEIRAYAEARHSWSTVGEITRKTYAGLLEKVL